MYMLAVTFHERVRVNVYTAWLCLVPYIFSRFCMSRKGGVQGGGWIHLQGANGVSHAGLNGL